MSTAIPTNLVTAQNYNSLVQKGPILTLEARVPTTASRIYMVGGLNDPEGWDHLDNEAKNVRPVSGTAEIDVNEIKNTGTFVARWKIPEGDLVLEMDRWNEFSPCRDGGIEAYVHEHGTDSGCGDANWPKTLGLLAGWGYGHG